MLERCRRGEHVIPCIGAVVVEENYVVLDLGALGHLHFFFYLSYDFPRHFRVLSSP